MLTRLLVAGVALVTAVAVADGVRGRGGELDSPGPAATSHPTARFLVRRVPDVEGRRSPPALAAIARAFPGAGRAEVAHVAVAPDGMLAIGVVRTVDERPVAAGVELWYARSLLRAFPVAPLSLAGGFGFSPDGRVVATYTADGRPSVYDRRGRRIPPNALRAF